MTTQQLAVWSNGEFYSTKSTEFLQHVDRVASDTFEWKDHIGKARKMYAFTNNLDQNTINHLWGIGDQSKVGKGSETVMDTEVRKSREILADSLTLNPRFLNELGTRGTKLLRHKLYSSGTPKFHFYKMVLYQEGDHFTWHIDSNHRENMFATMSVQLHVQGKNEGGDLFVSGRDNVWQKKDLCTGDDEEDQGTVETLEDICEVKSQAAPTPEKDNVSVTVFYHDTPHMVTEVTRGYRVSLIFDVTIDPTEAVPRTNLGLQTDLEFLKSKGIRRVGFLCNHLYMGETLTPSLLKGTDRYGYDVLKEYSASVEIVEVMKTSGKMFRSELMPLFTFLGMEVWRTVDWEYPEELQYHDRDQGELVEEITKRGKDIRSYQPAFDDGKYKAVADEYRLGDVLFFSSIGPARLIYTGDSEIHLGNEGFWGSIYEQVAVIATL